MARLTLSYGVAQVIAPALAGYVAFYTGSFSGALLLAAGVMAVGMVLLMVLQSRGGDACNPSNLIRTLAKPYADAV